LEDFERQRRAQRQLSGEKVELGPSKRNLKEEKGDSLEKTRSRANTVNNSSEIKSKFGQPDIKTPSGEDSETESSAIKTDSISKLPPPPVDDDESDSEPPVPVPVIAPPLPDDDDEDDGPAPVPVFIAPPPGDFEDEEEVVVYGGPPVAVPSPESDAENDAPASTLQVRPPAPPDFDEED
jgi:hypothetical protein